MQGTLMMFAVPLLTIAQFVAAIWLFVRTLPRRDHFWVRVAIVLAVAITGSIVSSVMGLAASPDDYGSYVLLFVEFVGIFVACNAVVLALFDVSVWTVLYCCMAAFAMQNIASGTDGMMAVFAGMADLTLGVLFFPFLAMIVPTVIIYAVTYRLLIRRVERYLPYVDHRPLMHVIMALVVCAIIWFSTVNKFLEQQMIAAGPMITLHVVHGVVCAFVLGMEYEMLINRQLQITAATTEQLLNAKQQQYDLSRQSIEAVNDRCHDMRHQILRMLSDSDANVDKELLSSVAHQISIYDAQVRTGNEALDVILGQKSLVCQSRQIALSVIADGNAVSFVAPADLYTLLGSALDNAIEATESVADPGARSIGVDIRMAMGMARITIDNSFEGKVRIVNDLPQTNNHWSDTQSMELVTNAYGGTITATAADGVYRLNVLLPVPDAA